MYIITCAHWNGNKSVIRVAADTINDAMRIAFRDLSVAKARYGHYETTRNDIYLTGTM